MTSLIPPPGPAARACPPSSDSPLPKGGIDTDLWLSVNHQQAPEEVRLFFLELNGHAPETRRLPTPPSPSLPRAFTLPFPQFETEDGKLVQTALPTVFVGRPSPYLCPACKDVFVDPAWFRNT